MTGTKEEKYDRIAKVIHRVREEIKERKQKLSSDLNQLGVNERSGEIGMRFNDAVQSLTTSAFKDIDFIVSFD